MIYLYGFAIYCVVVFIVGSKAAINKDDWMSRFGGGALTFFGTLVGVVLLFLLSLFTPDGTTWP